MEQITVIIFICIAMPLIPMLFVLPDRRSRLMLGYMLLGSAICLIAGEVNYYLLGLFKGDMLYVTTTITPISEELLKALPVLYFAALFSDKRDTLLSISFALGVGFAILENAVILLQHPETISVTWALARVIGAALMHGACTSAVGMGMSYVKKRKKLFFCGTFALLIGAVIIHASFNVLVQSEYRIAAFILPSLLYIPVVLKRRESEDE